MNIRVEQPPRRRVGVTGPEDGPVNRHQLAVLRDDPAEWRRRGLRAPTEIARLVAERLLPEDPTYGDFFVRVP